MKKICVISPTKYLSDALKSAPQLAGFEIKFRPAPLENEIAIYDHGVNYSLGNLEFSKPVVLNDIINAITNYEIHQHYQLGNIIFTPKTRKLFCGTKEESLTETETALLLKICTAKGGISINQLLLEVLGYDERVETKTIETHIYRLRQKIRTLTDEEILTSSSAGYIALK